MKKYLAVVCLLGSMLFVFVGCKKINTSSLLETSNSKEVEQTSSEKGEIEVSATEQASNPINKESFWDNDKSAKLQSFMDTWGQTMNQEYKQYNPNNNVDLYGLKLPDLVLDDNKWQVAINNAPIVINWSETGDEESGYSLVAVYSDAESQGDLAKHVYFFTVNSGVPKVLVTSQNQGNPNNYIYFKETENKEHRDGFNNIVNSNVVFDDVKSNFTKNEQISFFISNYGQLPYNGYLTTENDGNGMRITYYVDESIPNTKEAIVEAIENLKNISLSAQEQISDAIPIGLKEPMATEYTLTMTDGKPTQANHIFGRIIQGIE